MQKTNIGWTDYTSNILKYRNPKGVVVWACVHASDGCRNCYAEALGKRWGRGETFTAENMKALTPFFDTKEANEVLKSKKIAGKKVFVNDMTDLFGEWVSDEVIDQHFAVFALRPDVTFQILTKRAERMLEYLTYEYRWAQVEGQCNELVGPNESPALATPERRYLPNAHLGVSVEDQKNANERIPLLLETPAAVRWASIEPLLAPTDLTNCGEDLSRCVINALSGRNTWNGRLASKLDGIVIGGESGAGHREMPLDSAIALALNAREAGVSVYIKQDSGPRPGMRGRIPNDVWAMKEWPTA